MSAPAAGIVILAVKRTVIASIAVPGMAASSGAALVARLQQDQANSATTATGAAGT